MDSTRPGSHEILKRVVAPLTLWAVTKVLDAPRIKKAMKRVDQKVYKERRRAVRNARKNRIWLAAGLAAIVTGVSLVAKASKSR